MLYRHFLTTIWVKRYPIAYLRMYLIKSGATNTCKGLHPFVPGYNHGPFHYFSGLKSWIWSRDRSFVCMYLMSRLWEPSWQCKGDDPKKHTYVWQCVSFDPARPRNAPWRRDRLTGYSAIADTQRYHTEVMLALRVVMHGVETAPLQKLPLERHWGEMRRFIPSMEVLCCDLQAKLLYNHEMAYWLQNKWHNIEPWLKLCNPLISALPWRSVPFLVYRYCQSDKVPSPVSPTLWRTEIDLGKSISKNSKSRRNVIDATSQTLWLTWQHSSAQKHKKLSEVVMAR